MGSEAQLAWKCLFTPTSFRRATLTHEVGQTDLILVYDEGALVGLCTQDYKCLYMQGLRFLPPQLPKNMIFTFDLCDLGK